MNESNTAGLSKSERIFALEYCANSFNGTQAYKKAHPRASLESSRRNASRLLTKADIRKYIQEYLSEVLGTFRDTLEMQLIDIYIIRAFFNPFDYVDETGQLRPDCDMARAGLVIENLERKDGRDASFVKIRFCDRDKALEQLAKYANLIRQNLKEEESGTRVVLLPQSMRVEEWMAGFANGETIPSHSIPE